MKSNRLPSPNVPDYPSLPGFVPIILLLWVNSMLWCGIMPFSFEASATHPERAKNMVRDKAIRELSLFVSQQTDTVLQSRFPGFTPEHRFASLVRDIISQAEITVTPDASNGRFTAKILLDPSDTVERISNISQERQKQVRILLDSRSTADPTASMSCCLRSLTRLWECPRPDDSLVDSLTSRLDSLVQSLRIDPPTDRTFPVTEEGEIVFHLAWQGTPEKGIPGVEITCSSDRNDLALVTGADGTARHTLPGREGNQSFQYEIALWSFFAPELPGDSPPARWFSLQFPHLTGSFNIRFFGRLTLSLPPGLPERLDDFFRASGFEIVNDSDSSDRKVFYRMILEKEGLSNAGGCYATGRGLLRWEDSRSGAIVVMDTGTIEVFSVETGEMAGSKLRLELKQQIVDNLLGQLDSQELP